MPYNQSAGSGFSVTLNQRASMTFMLMTKTASEQNLCESPIIDKNGYIEI